MRDLKADLEICNKATPGPWLPGHLPDIEQDCEICKINAFYNKNVNREFVAQAREGWPHAIERAIKAEAEVERLRKHLEFANTYTCNPQLYWKETNGG